MSLEIRQTGLRTGKDGYKQQQQSLKRLEVKASILNSAHLIHPSLRALWRSANKKRSGILVFEPHPAETSVHHVPPFQIVIYCEDMSFLCRHGIKAGRR